MAFPLTALRRRSTHQGVAVITEGQAHFAITTELNGARWSSALDFGKASNPHQDGRSHRPRLQESWRAYEGLLTAVKSGWSHGELQGIAAHDP